MRRATNVVLFPRHRRWPPFDPNPPVGGGLPLLQPLCVTLAVGRAAA